LDFRRGLGLVARSGWRGVAWAVPMSLGLNLGFGLMLGILSGVIHTIL
jgi:hypothetical protein